MILTSGSIRLDRRFSKQARGRYEAYYFDVGILSDKLHRSPKPKSSGLKMFAGGPARKSGNMSSIYISEISAKLREHLKVNFYTHPFKSRKNRDILRFTKSFFDLCAGRTVKRRCENLLQAIVRNPILRGDYGSNSPLTVKIKGFNRIMIDTGQLFRNITAKVVRRRPTGV